MTSKQRIEIMQLADDIGNILGVKPYCPVCLNDDCKETHCLCAVVRTLYDLGWRKMSSETSNDKIIEYFEKTYGIYPRKVSKEQARKTYEHKLVGLDVESARKVANTIYISLEKQMVVWKNENEGAGRKVEHIPYFSTWLNDNFADSPYKKKKR